MSYKAPSPSMSYKAPSPSPSASPSPTCHRPFHFLSFPSAHPTLVHVPTPHHTSHPPAFEGFLTPRPQILAIIASHWSQQSRWGKWHRRRHHQQQQRRRGHRVRVVVFISVQHVREPSQGGNIYVAINSLVRCPSEPSSSDGWTDGVFIYLQMKTRKTILVRRAEPDSPDLMYFAVTPGNVRTTWRCTDSVRATIRKDEGQFRRILVRTWNGSTPALRRISTLRGQGQPAAHRSMPSMSSASPAMCLACRPTTTA